MFTLSVVNREDVLRFYERVHRLRPTFPAEAKRTAAPSFIEISAEAKKKLVLEMARAEVLERIRR